MKPHKNPMENIALSRCCETDEKYLEEFSGQIGRQRKQIRTRSDCAISQPRRLR